MLCRDVLQIIMDFATAKEQLNMHSSCKDFYTNLKITFTEGNLTDAILSQDKYRHLEILDASFNKDITTVKHLLYLKELDCCGAPVEFGIPCGGINQKAINELHGLKKLYAKNNPTINSVNHLKKLTLLDCRGTCGIDQHGISELSNLTILNANNNKKITSINHLKKLTHLRCRHNCGINQNGISLITTLKILDAGDNRKIVSVNHNRKLLYLQCDKMCGINQNGISELREITHFIASMNMIITDISHLHNITHLMCRFVRIDEESIIGLKKIRYMTFIHIDDLKNNIYREKIDLRSV